MVQKSGHHNDGRCQMVGAMDMPPRCHKCGQRGHFFFRDCQAPDPCRHCGDKTHTSTECAIRNARSFAIVVAPTVSRVPKEGVDFVMHEDGGGDTDRVGDQGAGPPPSAPGGMLVIMGLVGVWVRRGGLGWPKGDAGGGAGDGQSRDRGSPSVPGGPQGAEGGVQGSEGGGSPGFRWGGGTQ